MYKNLLGIIQRNNGYGLRKRIWDAWMAEDGK